MRLWSPLFIGFALSMSLVACGGEEPVEPLPEGEQTISGILKPTEISVSRRGTHLIEQDGVELYYAESALVNLRDYQNKRVTLRGTLEYNIDTVYLPVLVVESVVDVEDTVKEHVFAEIGTTLAAPIHWKVVKREGRQQFRLPDDEEIILQVWQEAGQELPEGGVPIVVDATRATRLIDELTGSQHVIVKRPDQLLHLLFTPGNRVSADRLREDFVQILSSVELKAPERESTSTGTGSLGAPCGGAAGILCPTGYFCDVQDLEENIGRCRKI